MHFTFLWCLFVPFPMPLQGSVAKTSVATGDDPLTADGEECDGRQQPATVVVQTEDGSGENVIVKLSLFARIACVLSYLIS